MKIAVVGGGSTYTPELIDGMARLRDSLPLTEIVLVDPVVERRELVAGMARRMLARTGHPAVVSTTDDVSSAAVGAAVVLVQLRVGGQNARIGDETWPLECGCVGQETTGAGGLAKALRTVPVVLDIADKVRAVNPDAWIVDFTNPVGIVTRALLAEGHKAVGLCNVAIGLQRFFAGLLQVEPGRIALDHIGLNHLTFVRAVWERQPDGTVIDRLPVLLDVHGPQVAEKLNLPLDLLRSTGTVPSYYLRYFYLHDQVVAEQQGAPSRGQAVADLETELLELYADPSVDTKPAALDKRGGAYYSEAAVDLMASLLTDAGDVQVVNTLNNGTLPFLPDDMVVEVPATITAAGPVPLPVAPVSPQIAGLIAHVAGYEQLALDAARSGSRDKVVAALLAHPLVGQWELAQGLADRLLAHNQEHLSW